jgi:hypothetical protein
VSIVALPTFKGYFRSEISADDSIIQAVLDATDSVIQEICQRKFVVAGSASARTYAPTVGRNVLRIHDCTTITSVVENSTTLTADTDFVKEPVQTVSWSGETRPYEQVRRIGASWYTDNGKGTVVVTATWGWAAIPSAVTQAALIGAKEILDQREVRFGIAAVNEFGPLRVRANPEVQRLLAPYMRVEGFGIA